MSIKQRFACDACGKGIDPEKDAFVELSVVRGRDGLYERAMAHFHDNGKCYDEADWHDAAVPATPALIEAEAPPAEERDTRSAAELGGDG